MVMKDRATIRVRTDRVLGEVSPLLYGSFAEHLVHIVYDGLWSEKLFGRKFEAPMIGRARPEMAAPWTPFPPTVDGWTTYPRGTAPLNRFASPQYQAHHAQAVFVSPGNDGAERGLAQPDVVVDGGTTYRFCGSVRRIGPAATLRVALRARDGTSTLAEATVEVPAISATRFGPSPALNHLWTDDTSWQEVEASLTASGSDEDGWLTLTFEPSPGEMCAWWFDWVSLMPADNVGGWHATVVDELRALPVQLLKWPGGCMADDYDWRYGIGSRDRRYGSVDQAWATWDENDVGTDEFIELCRLTGAEPVLGVNAGSGTPEMAAEWVEYCNGSPDTKWGGMRAANGHPDPFDVRYWAVGNEQWGFFERGYSGPDGYAERYLAFAEAMRRTDPSITLVAVGHPGEFSRIVLERCAPHLDMLQIHFYTPEIEEDVANPAAASRKITSAQAFDELFTRISEDIAAVDGASHVRVCLDEWGWARGGHAGAMFTAAAMNAMHRAAPLVALAARAAVINVDGVLSRRGEDVRRTPLYDVYRLYGLGHQPFAVATELEDDAGRLDVSCIFDPSTGGLTVYVVNNGGEPTAVAIEVAALKPGTPVETHEVVAGPDGPGGSSVVTTSTIPWSADRELPPLSLTVLRFANWSNA